MLGLCRLGLKIQDKWRVVLWKWSVLSPHCPYAVVLKLKQMNKQTKEGMRFLHKLKSEAPAP